MSAPTSSTPSPIIHIVVLTAAVAFLGFFATLIAMQFSHVTPDEKVFEAFKMAGTSTMSFLFGILVNTRVPEKDNGASTTISTESKVVKESEPKKSEA